jgi:hypothetical protein
MAVEAASWAYDWEHSAAAAVQALLAASPGLSTEAAEQEAVLQTLRPELPYESHAAALPALPLCAWQAM